jgi:DNA-binding XRE family transcriptional regulator
MVTNVEVGQRWSRRDPEGSRVVEFVVVGVKLGAVTGVTDTRKPLKARAPAMLSEERYTYLGVGRVPDRREEGSTPEKEFVRRSTFDRKAEIRRHNEIVGAAVRRLRMAQHMTIPALAEASGASKSTIDHVEAGDSPLSLFYASKIAEALDCTIDDLSPVTTSADERAA